MPNRPGTGVKTSYGHRRRGVAPVPLTSQSVNQAIFNAPKTAKKAPQAFLFPSRTKSHVEFMYRRTQFQSSKTMPGYQQPPQTASHNFRRNNFSESNMGQYAP